MNMHTYICCIHRQHTYNHRLHIYGLHKYLHGLLPRIHSFIHPCIHSYIHTYMHAYKCACIITYSINKHTCIQYPHAYSTHMHTPMCIQYIDKCIHIHIHAYICKQDGRLECRCETPISPVPWTWW